MIFRQKDFWMNVPKGTEVVVKKVETSAPMKLYFDEIREFNDYGLSMLYVCLQKDVKDLGNRSMTVPLVVDDIVDVISVGGKPIKEFRKEIKAAEKSEKIEPETTVSESLPSKPEPETLPELLPEQLPMAGTTASDEEKDTAMTEKAVPRKRKEYDFVITEKDGKFLCPCGSSFGRRDTAIYVHRTRHNKKPQ